MKRRTEVLNKMAVMFVMAVALLAGTFLFGGKVTVQAEDAAEVTVTAINYDNLTMTLNAGGNTLLYYSKNKTDWNELEYYTDEAGNRVMDISWISESSDMKLYFKGDKNTKIVSVVIPKRNTALKVTFNKVDGTLAFDNYEDAETFQWRKATDYNWTTVSMDEASASYQMFLRQLETLRVKGAKILVRTPAVDGTGAGDTGVRPSREVSVSVSKRSSAPSVSLSVSKLTVNTTDRHEYSVDGGQTWKPCYKTMPLYTMLPQVFRKNGTAVDGTLLIRTAETEKSGYSKTAILPVAAQRMAPNVSEVLYYQESSRFVLQFPAATRENQYEYKIVKPGKEFDETGSGWRSVTSDRLTKLSAASLPDGSTIYYRYKGITASKTKGINAELPSVYGSFVVNLD